MIAPHKYGRPNRPAAVMANDYLQFSATEDSKRVKYEPALGPEGGGEQAELCTAAHQRQATG